MIGYEKMACQGIGLPEAKHMSTPSMHSDAVCHDMAGDMMNAFSMTTNLMSNMTVMGRPSTVQ